MKHPVIKSELFDILCRLYDSEIFQPMFEFMTGACRVLFYLDSNRKRTVRPTELSEKLCVSRQRIAAELTQLKNKGYIMLHSSSTNKRAVIISITESGTEYVMKKLNAANKLADDLIDKIGIENTKHINRILSELIVTCEKTRNE